MSKASSDTTLQRAAPAFFRRRRRLGRSGSGPGGDDAGSSAGEQTGSDGVGGDGTGSSVWGRYGSDALALAEAADIDPEALDWARATAPPFRWSPGRMSCNWFFQGIDTATVGGVMTALRIADRLRAARGVRQRFVLCGPADLRAVSARVLAAFPDLRGSEFIALDSPEKLACVPAADIGVATLWTTAYVLAQQGRCARKMYLIQDFEPLFYPAGSTSAQAEHTYRLGLEGIANTETLAVLYRDRYGGDAVAFTPQVDVSVFHPGPAELRGARRRVFFYARPENPRNAFELCAAALKRLKRRLGEAVEIVCAGADFDPARYGLEGVVKPLGRLPYEETGALYRRCHVGLSCMLTPHPSYLPFELMACGALVVALRNEANAWLIEDGVTALTSDPTASALAERLHQAVTGWDDLAPVRAEAQRRIDRLAGRGWAAELDPVIAYMTRTRDDQGQAHEYNAALELTDATDSVPAWSRHEMIGRG